MQEGPAEVTINSLPLEVLFNIFSYLTWKDTVNLRPTSKTTKYNAEQGISEAIKKQYLARLLILDPALFEPDSATQYFSLSWLHEAIYKINVQQLSEVNHLQKLLPMTGIFNKLLKLITSNEYVAISEWELEKLHNITTPTFSLDELEERDRLIERLNLGLIARAMAERIRLTNPGEDLKLDFSNCSLTRFPNYQPFRYRFRDVAEYSNIKCDNNYFKTLPPLLTNLFDEKWCKNTLNTQQTLPRVQIPSILLHNGQASIGVISRLKNILHQFQKPKVNPFSTKNDRPTKRRRIEKSSDNELAPSGATFDEAPQSSTTDISETSDLKELNIDRKRKRK